MSPLNNGNRAQEEFEGGKRIEIVATMLPKQYATKLFLGLHYICFAEYWLHLLEILMGP